jgi:hypothetical protein
MRLFHGIVSVLLGLVALYLMFIRAKTDQDFILGFMVLLISIIFMCFMIMAEQKNEIEFLRHNIMKMKGMI